jgi:hypothetical protein
MTNKYTPKGYIESKASVRRKSKEDTRVQELIPTQILEDTKNDGTGSSVGIEVLLDAYYRFMNLDEFSFLQEETYTALVLSDGSASFRISDPNLENNKFFTKAVEGTQTIVTDDPIPVTIVEVGTYSNGNNIPAILEDGFSKGKTLTVTGLTDHIGKILTLDTQTINYRKDGPSSVINTINDAMNIDSATEEYLNMMQKEIAAYIPKGILTDRRSLYKKLLEYYKIRGSSESIETFFRILFNEEVEVEFPYESTLIPSSGDWDVEQNLYLNKKGFLSDTIKLQDSYFYQKFSYVIKTGRNVQDWEDVYNRLVHPAGFIFFGEILVITELVRNRLGDGGRGGYNPESTLIIAEDDPERGKSHPRTNRSTLSSMPGEQPGLIGAEDLPIIIEIMASMFGRSADSTLSRRAILDFEINAGEVTSVNIIDGGTGYPNITNYNLPTDQFSLVPLPGLTATAPTITVSSENGSVISASVSDPGQNLVAVNWYLEPSFLDGGVDRRDFVTNLNLSINQINKYDHITIPKIIIDPPANTDGTSPATAEFRNIDQSTVIAPSSINMKGDGAFVTSDGDDIRNIEWVSAPEIGVYRNGFKGLAFSTVLQNSKLYRISYKTSESSGASIINGYSVRVTGTSVSGVIDAELPNAIIIFPPFKVADPDITSKGYGYFLPPSVRIKYPIQPKIARVENVVKTFQHGSVLDYYDNKGQQLNRRIFNINYQIDELGQYTIENITPDLINNINTHTFITKPDTSETSENDLGFSSTNSGVDIILDDLNPVATQVETAGYGASSESAGYGASNQEPYYGP